MSSPYGAGSDSSGSLIMLADESPKHVTTSAEQQMAALSPRALLSSSAPAVVLATTPRSASRSGKKKKQATGGEENAPGIAGGGATKSPGTFPSSADIGKSLSPLMASSPFREAAPNSPAMRLQRSHTVSGAITTPPPQQASSAPAVAAPSVSKPAVHAVVQRLHEKSLRVPFSSPIAPQGEFDRWNDVKQLRLKNGVTSPLNISVNALRLFAPAQIKQVTGHVPVFDVVLEDPFAATPDRQRERTMLNRKARGRALSFQLVDSGATPMQLEIAASAPNISVAAAATATAAASAGAATGERQPTPRTANVAVPISHNPPAPPGAAAAAAKNKKKKKRAAAGLAGKAATFSVTRAAAPRREMDFSESGRPTWAPLGGLLQWILAEGTQRDRFTLALTYRHVMKADELELNLELLFKSDATVDRRVRRGVLAFVSQWVDVMRFHSPDHYKDSLLESLCHFVQHTADLYEKMAAQRHTQAQLYVGSKELARTLTTLREQIGFAFNVKAARDDETYFVQGRLRDDADAVALYAARMAWAGGAGPETVPEAQTTSAALLRMDTRKLAHALTHVDSALFSEITGYDILCGARNGPAVIPNRLLNTRRVLRINHIVTSTAHWNTLSRWVPSCVLGEPDVKVRAKLVKRFIQLGAELKALHNYSSFFAIMIGLGSGTLSALKETWRLVPAKYVATFRELEEHVQPMCNFQRYRVAVAECIAAGIFCVPYMAIVLKDFQAVEEGNPTRDYRGWINFGKLELLASVLQQVRTMQAVPSPFRISDKRHIQFVAQIASRGETELWEESKVVKQREAAVVQAQQARTSRW